MDNQKVQSFLFSVVGKEGTKALANSETSIPGLKNLIVPRVISGWVNSLSSFKGKLPGNQEDIEINIFLGKSEERLFSIKGGGYEKTAVSVNHVSAFIASQLGLDLDLQIPDRLRNIEISRLGKSIDLLIKAVAEEAKPKEISKTTYVSLQSIIEGAKKNSKPVPKSKVSNLPKKGEHVLKLTKAELQKECPLCTGSQFQGEEIVGCLCFRSLMEGVKVRKNETLGYYELQLSSEWLTDDILLFLQQIKG